jgi:thiamine-phosphate pyrophosphorylase
MKLHALVDDLETARMAVEGGATVVQLRLKGASTLDVVERGRSTRSLCARHGVTFVVNDDVEAALMLGADGVHLGRSDEGAERAKEQGLLLGLSAASVEEAKAAEQADYIGAGPVWATPSKPDADPPIGLEGLAGICDAVCVPVVAIGGIDATNAADCIRAGAIGVAVIRAALDADAIRKALDEAL